MTKEEYISDHLDRLFQLWFFRSAGWGAVLILGLSGLDYLAAPEHFTVFLVYRIIVAVVLVASALAALRMDAPPGFFRLLGYAVIFLSAAAIELMILQLGGHRSSYYVGMILLGVAVVGFVPARMSFHALTVLGIYSIYLAPVLIADRIVDVRLFITANIFMGAIFATAMVSRLFAFRGLMTELGQRYEIEQYRQHLEDLVHARTGELAETVARLRNEVGERRQAEQKLRDSLEELKERTEELDSLAYSIAHDLRAPLVNIRGFSAELMNSLRESLAPTGSPADGRDDEPRKTLSPGALAEIPVSLGFINTAADRMSRSLSAMLKLFRISRRELKPEPIDLGGLMREALEDLAGDLAKKKVRVSVGPMPSLVADRQSIGEVMRILVDNAAKYSDHAPAAKIEIQAEQRGRDTVVSVRDNGRGIARDDLAKVFEIFRRAGAQDVPGDGMGLAYAKALIRRQGGRIWCESEPGHGSVFHFSVPDAAK